GEPAAWANRGLVHLRENELKEAATDLAEAHKLAPESAEIENLLGWLAQKQGRFDKAADHFRKALEHAPQDLLTRFALAQILEKRGGTDGDMDYQRELEAILTIQPNNLYVLKELVNVTARRKDERTLQAAVERLRNLSPTWSRISRERFAELEKAARGPLPGNVPSTLSRLVGSLSKEQGYALSKDAVEGRDYSKGALVGTSVQQFLRLEPVRATPAPPDTELAFDTGPLPDSPGGRWDTVRVVWMTDSPDPRRTRRAWRPIELGSDKWVPDGPGPTVLVANGREVRRTGSGSFALKFPGGSTGTPPTAACIVALDWHNDYRTDLLLAGAGGLRFYQQGDKGEFTDVTEKTGLAKEILQPDY